MIQYIYIHKKKFILGKAKVKTGRTVDEQISLNDIYVSYLFFSLRQALTTSVRRYDVLIRAGTG
jgi:hypothetical protein